MAGKRDREYTDCQPNSNQRLPKGNFDTDGLSRGSQSGPCRPTPDAYQGPRSEGESTPAKPAN